jgi:dihydroorotate dehydrogenase electron transfer subunit
MPETLHRPARIVKTVRENEKTTSFILDHSMEAVPGQFAMLWLPGLDEKPFSIAAAAHVHYFACRPFQRRAALAARG